MEVFGSQSGFFNDELSVPPNHYPSRSWLCIECISPGKGRRTACNKVWALEQLLGLEASFHHFLVV